MNGEQRREKIIDILNSSSKPVSGVALASMLNVSRQVIVQDIALIRASDNEISSTNRGYVIRKKNEHTRIFKVVHTEADAETERDIKDYMAEIGNGKSNLLMNVTSGYHYHTVIAPDEDTLDIIQEKLDKLGFLARLQEYEPVDFWSSKA